MKNKTIIVAGGTGGIGSATCELLASHGASVVIVGRTHSLPRDKTIRSLVLDLQSMTAWERLIEIVVERFHHIDVLVNCVGILVPGRLDTLTSEEIHNVISTNFTSAVYGTRAVLPLMKRQGFGQIIQVGSLGGIVPMPFEALYSATKFALRGFSLSLNEELKGTGVRVSLISPGPVHTAMLNHEATDDRSTFSFVNKPLAPSQVAGAILRVIQKPKRETFIPKLSSRLALVASLFPNSFGFLYTLLNGVGRIHLKNYQAKYLHHGSLNLKGISHGSGR